MINFIKSFCGLIGGFLGWYIGGLDGLIVVLITFVIVDYITGILKAIYTKSLSSEIGFIGIARKILIFVVVGIANIIDLFIICSGSALRSAICMFYLANEGISILENVAACGVEIPNKLKSILEQLQEEEQ